MVGDKCGTIVGGTPPFHPLSGVIDPKYGRGAVWLKLADIAWQRGRSPPSLVPNPARCSYLSLSLRAVAASSAPGAGTYPAV